MAAVLLSATGLGLERGGRCLLADFRLRVKPGELVLLEGPNGAGKTTLLRSLAGLSTLGQQGQVRRCGESLLYLGHRSGLKQQLTPRENLRWYCAAQGRGRGQGVAAAGDVVAALAQVGLQGYEDVPCQRLSAGQQRRVGLARLYLGTADLWLLDEPFSTIDRAGVQLLAARLQQQLDGGGALVIATHEDLPLRAPRQRVVLGAGSMTVPAGGGFLVGSLRRQLSAAWRRPVEIAAPLLFFLLVVALFPLGLGPAPARLQVLAPGILWIVALLATLLAAEGLFRADLDDGSLEQLVLAPPPLFLSALVYVLAHWLLTGLPLTLLAPLCAAMLQLPVAALPTLLGSLALGTALLSLLGGIGAALTVGLQRGAGLIGLIILPLYVPVLIFGSEAVALAATGHDAAVLLLRLAGMLALALALAPFAIAAGLRLAVDAA